MESTCTDKRAWTRVSEDGKSAAAGMSLGPALGTKPGGGGEEQPYDDHGRYLGTLHAANGRGRVATDAGGGRRRSPLGKGQERGQKNGKLYVLPKNVMEENKRIALVYCQSSGEFTDMEDRLLGKGYSGAPGNMNVPASQGKKGLGVIPRRHLDHRRGHLEQERDTRQRREPHPPRARCGHGRARACHGPRPEHFLHSCGKKRSK